MGLEPVSTIIILGTIATVAAITALQVEENERKKRDERRRRMDKARRKQEKARIKQKQEDTSEDEVETSEDEVEQDVTYRRTSRPVYDNSYDINRSPYTPPRRNNLCECGSCYSEPQRRYNDWNSEYSLSESRYYPYGSSWTTQTRPFPYDDSFSSSPYRQNSDNVCGCGCCSPENTRPRIYLPSTENEEREERQWDSKPYNPSKSIFETTKKRSVTVTVKPPSTTSNSTSLPQQDKNEKKNAEQKLNNKGTNPGSKSGSSGSNATGSNRTTSQKSTSPAVATGSGSQEPERDGNGKKDEDDVDYGSLKDFIKLLKEILDRCQCSPALRKKIIDFFKNFDKHKDKFIWLLGDIKEHRIEEDVLSIVVQLFKSDAFANHVTYSNFICLIEFVAKYIKDEAKLEIAKEDDGASDGIIIKLPTKVQLSENIKRVVARTDIVTSITELFNKIREEIIDDNTARPLVIDFPSIFSKVYHYFKHRVVRDKVLTVKEYFDLIRELLPLVMDLKPEYPDLLNRNNPRREIIFEMYLTVFKGYILIVVRVYGCSVSIRSVYVKEKKDKNAKDRDKKVDGKKRT